MTARYWKHNVDERWLQARRRVLTATEISKLIPELKRAAKLKPGEISPGFAAVWAEKHSDMQLDTSSVGAAARGHIMEPWVVQAYNEQVTAGERFNHWDDCIICNDLIGFSPDAMNVMQDKVVPKLMVHPNGDRLQTKDGKVMFAAPIRIMEIKCYEPANHMKAIITPRMEHKELVQVAVAFYVLPKLKEAKLCFCCPGAPIPMHVETYTREDFKELLETIKQIVTLYVDTAMQCTGLARKYEAGFTEDEVYKDYLQSLDDKQIYEL